MLYWWGIPTSSVPWIGEKLLVDFTRNGAKISERCDLDLTGIMVRIGVTIPKSSDFRNDVRNVWHESTNVYRRDDVTGKIWVAEGQQIRDVKLSCGICNETGRIESQF